KSWTTSTALIRNPRGAGSAPCSTRAAFHAERPAKSASGPDPARRPASGGLLTAAVPPGATPSARQARQGVAPGSLQPAEQLPRRDTTAHKGAFIVTEGALIDAPHHPYSVLRRSRADRRRRSERRRSGCGPSAPRGADRRARRLARARCARTGARRDLRRRRFTIWLPRLAAGLGS